MNEPVTILVVDDQPDLLSNLELTLESEGYRVLTAGDGLEALNMMHANQVDLILADIAMPRMNGYQLFEQVREQPHWLAIPFLFLTARTLDSDIRYGKELGVDDYLTKPIQPEDLLASVHGKLRRAEQMAHAQSSAPAAASSNGRTLHVGTLRIDPDQHRAWLHNEPMPLSAREFTLLEYLARRVNMVVSPKELIRATHNLDTDHEEAGTLLRPLIRTLRRKLGYPVGEIGCIEVVRGVGYRLSPPG
jgi:DNA-binding response OmpR family regulator